MAKLILASVFCIFLLVKGIEAGEVAAGESCDGLTTTCIGGAYCEGTTCKIKVAQTCVSGSTNNCILHASCPTSGDNLNKCTCDVGYTANNDKTVCATTPSCRTPWSEWSSCPSCDAFSTRSRKCDTYNSDCDCSIAVQRENRDCECSSSSTQ
ncbi:uncharacterized protein [Littorina saxatilis]|uniref:Uncharacterized protein n=1 Tax=Littorina saxatilis TaxID=31220 RepID=A0AAN9AWS1_9CAEN